jgi:hypothetical protein
MIRQDVGQTVLGGGDTLSVTYLALGDNVVDYQDASDVSATAAAEGGSGRYMRLWDKSDAFAEDQTTAMAEAMNAVSYGETLATEIIYDVETATLATASQIQPGQTQNINLPYYSINADYLIDQVSIRDVDGQYLRITVRALSGAFLDNWVDFYRNLFKT